MVKDIDLEILDVNNSIQRIGFEQNFYEAFNRAPDPTLENIWFVDHLLKRIKPRIPYENLEGYILKVCKEIVGGCIVNLNMEIPLQLEVLGFQIDKTQGKTAESLCFFNNRQVHKSYYTLPFLAEFIFKKLRKKKIEMFYMTAGHAKAKRYVLAGWEIIDEKKFGDWTECLMKIKL